MLWCAVRSWFLGSCLGSRQRCSSPSLKVCVDAYMLMHAACSRLSIAPSVYSHMPDCLEDRMHAVHFQSELTHWLIMLLCCSCADQWAPAQRARQLKGRPSGGAAGRRDGEGVTLSNDVMQRGA